MAVEEQTIIQREAPEVEALKLGLIRAAKGLAETAPVGGLPQTQFAGYDPFQDQARTMASSAIGSFAPFLTSAFAGNQQASDMLSGQVTDAYNNALASYSDADRDALLNTAGTRVGSGILNQGNDRIGIINALKAGNIDVDTAQGLLGTSTGNVRGNIFGTPGQAGTGALSAIDAARLGIDQGVTRGATSDVNRARIAQETALANARAAGTYGRTQADAGIAALSGTGGVFDPSATVSKFFNPYETNVVDRSLADLQRASNIAGLQEDANAAQAGAFGGSRAGIVQAERDRNLLDAQARIAAQLRQQGYGQALGQAQQAFESGQGRQQQLAQLTGQLGQAGAATQLSGEQLAQQGALSSGQLGLSASQAAADLALRGGQLGLSAEQLASENARQRGALGLQGASQAASGFSQAGALAGDMARLGLSEAELRANVGLQGAQLGMQGAQGLQSVANDIGAQAAQRAALAELQSGLQSNDISMMNQLGGQRFQTEQAQLDAQQQDQLAEVYEPYQRLGFYSDILRGAPTTQMSISQSSTPNPSLLNQVVGGAASGLGIAGAASKIF
jgi:hypothetical protein